MSQYSQLADQLEALIESPPTELLDDEPVRKRILQAATRIVPEISKPEDTAQRIVYTSLEVMAARIGNNLGLFHKLIESKNPLTTKDIAESKGVETPVVERLLKFIASMGMIKEVDVNTWGPSTFTEHMIIPGIEQGVNHNFDNLGSAFLAGPSYLERTKYRTPQDIKDSAFSQARGIDKNIFQWFSENPEAMAKFNLWMTVQRYGGRLWLDHFPFEKVVCEGGEITEDTVLFVDLGGNIGHQCEALKNKLPNLKGRVILQDQSHVLENALSIQGVEKVPIDFFQEQPVKGARAYYMRNILHDWPDAECIKILQNIKAAMAPESKLLIDEMVIPMKGAPRIAMQTDMVMLLACTAEERSEGRWKELLSAAGFKIDEIYTYQEEISNSIIVTTPADTT
jgi:demethylsterigmatocystin 6-O-methyltransferase